MPSTVVETRFAPRWLHAWAVLTAGVTVALLALGAMVTTFQVGMADPIWPTYPWHLALIDWHEPKRGFIIEHTHRLAGYIVGFCVLVLTIGLFTSVRQTWLKWLGVAALLGVIVQGLFGGYRVVLHAWLGTNLAIIHGCFAQVVFSLLVILAVVTSTRYARAALPLEGASRFRFWSLVLTALVFLQLVWGALLRHTNGALAQRMHLLTAFAVVAVFVWFAHTVGTSPSARRILGRTILVLSVLLVFQVSLGVESWVGKFNGIVPPELQKPTDGQAATRIAHVVIGSFVLAASVALTLLAHRSVGRDAERSASPRIAANPAVGDRNLVQQLEGSV
jgi:cytochrome c oxidase assembly protein subunit 15